MEGEEVRAGLLAGVDEHRFGRRQARVGRSGGGRSEGNVEK